MRNTTLTSVLLASSIAFAGCGGGGDGGGGGTAGTGGSGGGAALSFNAETALPAMGGAAAVTAVSALLGTTVSSILEALVAAPGAASLAVTPKDNIPVPGFCGGSGTAVLDWNDADSDREVSAGDVVTLELDECVGSAFAGAGVSGDMTLTVTDVSGDLPFIGGSIGAAAVLDLRILPGTSDTIAGSFDAFVEVSSDFSMIDLRLGNQLDDDTLAVSQGGQVLQLGCFEILTHVPLGFVAPLGVAKLAGQIYTINDYAASPPQIEFDPSGVPSTGTMTLHSGDLSGQSSDRSGPCPEFAAEGDGSSINATFSSGGCIALQGENPSFESSTSWDKLLDGDFTSGSGGVCGGVTCDELRADAVFEIIADSDFQDSNWQVEVVPTAGAMYDVPVVRQESGGVGDSAFRHMTHSIQPETNCAENCGVTVGLVHTIAQTYDPNPVGDGGDGPIAFINYTEAQKLITPGFNGAAVGWAFAVVQDGRRFNGPQTTAFTVSGWTTNGHCGLTEDDFGGDGPHPNFSGGGALSFAFIRSNSNTSAVAAVTNVHGIDDFEVVIVKE